MYGGFENVVLGCGAAGKNLAWDLVLAGRRTAVIERALIGRLVPQHRLPAQQERDP